MLDEMEIAAIGKPEYPWREWKGIRNAIRDRFGVQADYTDIHRKFGGKK